jgi:hypothetical protein
MQRAVARTQIAPTRITPTRLTPTRLTPTRLTCRRTQPQVRIGYNKARFADRPVSLTGRLVLLGSEFELGNEKASRQKKAGEAKCFPCRFLFLSH